MKRVGAIDIGTNSFLCLIADVESGKIVKTISDQVQIVRLGEGVHKNREFTAGALERTRECFKQFRILLDQHNVTRVQGVATSAARDVKNGQELFNLGNEFDIPINVIAGSKEAELTYKGVLTNPKFQDDIVVIDVGGGSTEITFQDQNKKIQGQSLDIGAVRLTEMFISSNPVRPDELNNLRYYAREKVAAFSQIKNKKLVGVAGTPTTIAALEQRIDYTQESIEGYVLSVKTLEGWVQKLAAMPIKERSLLKGLEPKRADIIVAGATILHETARVLGGLELTVSTRGVRYGLAAELGE